MGFWHTGYAEFHETVGLDDPHFVPPPIKYTCGECGISFSSSEALRFHRFESHPLRRPAFFVKGLEIGGHPMRITAPLNPKDIHVMDCDGIYINDKQIPMSLFQEQLASIKLDSCNLLLVNGNVKSEYKLEFRIASQKDLLGIEKEFVEMARRRQLNLRSIDDFICAASRFRSAIGYCDGICTYLYGVMARERHTDSSLSYEEYEKKFNLASHELSSYDRPLSRIISSLISFHFNHFGETTSRGGDSRVGRAANRFEAWLSCIWPGESKIEYLKAELSQIEAFVTDWDTERIADWSTLPLDELGRRAEELEAFLCDDVSDYDGAKVHILLAEAYNKNKNRGKSLLHAKALRNMPSLERWAESMIRKNTEGNNGKKWF